MQLFLQNIFTVGRENSNKCERSLGALKIFYEVPWLWVLWFGPASWWRAQQATLQLCRGPALAEGCLHQRSDQSVHGWRTDRHRGRGSFMVLQCLPASGSRDAHL